MVTLGTIVAQAHDETCIVKTVLLEESASPPLKRVYHLVRHGQECGEVEE